MTEFSIEPVISKQMNGRELFLNSLETGTILEVRTLHHTYSLIIKNSRDFEVILVGNDEAHSIPRVYRLNASFSDLEEFQVLPGVVREGYQLEFESGNTILQTSFVDTVRIKRRNIYTWILKKSFEQNLLGRICSSLIKRQSRFFYGAAFLQIDKHLHLIMVVIENNLERYEKSTYF